MAARKQTKKQDAYLAKLFKATNKDEIEKVIIIENNHVHTYGYEKPGISKTGSM